MDLVVTEVEMNTMRCSTTQTTVEISDGLWRPMESGLQKMHNAHTEIYVLTISLAELTNKS